MGISIGSADAGLVDFNSIVKSQITQQRAAHHRVYFVKQPLFVIVTVFAVCFGNLMPQAHAGETTAPFRPPAVPLVTFDPYLSVWSEADHLTDKNTQHWTRQEQPLASLIRIDGKTYRLMGTDPKNVPAFPQISLNTTPTRSIYEFEGEGVHVTMTFMTAALPQDLDVFSRPLSYITWQVHSVNGASHDVSIYDSTSSLLGVNDPHEVVQCARQPAGNLTALRVGTLAQSILGLAGEYVRINWGYAYAAAPSAEAKAAIGANHALLNQFVESGNLPGEDDQQLPRSAKDNTPVLAFVFELGSVGATAVQRRVIVAYDEIYAIKYFGKKMRPYWRRNGMEPMELLQTAAKDYPSLLARCEQFDGDLMADLTKFGGKRYAEITALAYRECIAGCGLAADANGQPLFFTKENTSGGVIATVDVIYPMDPVWILLSPTLTKATLVPILSYAASPRWKFPNAPHDLGDYPWAFGRDDGGEAMPVEESGNMIILCDAVAHVDGNADFVTPWWPQLTQWAEYLENYGLDPENQLCTDDFMGHLAHNANLSVKAILALAAYGDLCKMRGDEASSEKYAALAKVDAEHWTKVAADDDHYRLAFDKPDTWSQKYNLVWDRILGLNVFPPAVAQKEVAYYNTVMQRYGLPLDSRTHLTKADWSIWSATLANHQADFEAFISPIYDYLNETTIRDPIADSYMTDDVHSGGMHARPVVGGFFIKMLTDRDLWKKWSSGYKVKAADWAPLPLQIITEIVPTSRQTPVVWHYTFKKPTDDWIRQEFDDSRWEEGPGGFGTAGTPGAVVRTTWNTDDIWLRRTFTMPAGDHANLQFYVYHDEDVEIYVNGVLAATESGFFNGYEPMEIKSMALALLKPGALITLAVHCHQTAGGQDIDVGLAQIKESKPNQKTETSK